MNTNTQNTTKYKNSPLGLIPEDWEVKRLNEVTDYVDYRGKTPQKKDSGILLVTSRNIKQGYIDYDISKEYISENDYDNVMSRGLPEIGDVVVTTEAPMGNVAQINRIDIALAQRVIKFRAKPNIIANDYLKYYLLSEKFQRILDEKSTGGTVKGIKGSTLHKMILISPPLPEQVAIANCLSTWDAAIEKHTALIAQKELAKKALMQQLLSGKKRLKGFSGEWKEVKLGEICNITMGQSPSSENYNENSNGLPLVQGNADIKNRKTIDRYWTSEITKICEENDIIMTVRAPVGSIALAIQKACIGRGVCSIKAKKENNNFIYFYLIMIEPSWKTFEQGSTFTAVNSYDIKNIKLSIPSLQEQTAIANVLQCADTEIQLLQNKLTQIKEQKKGLMQVLLTGKKRLKY